MEIRFQFESSKNMQVQRSKLVKAYSVILYRSFRHQTLY